MPIEFLEVTEGVVLELIPRFDLSSFLEFELLVEKASMSILTV